MKPQNKVNDSGTLLSTLVILLSLPSAFFGVVSVLPGSLLDQSWLNRITGIPVIAHAIGIAWVVVAFGGRYLLFVAFVLDVFLILRRDTPAWLKSLATALIVLVFSA